jgi:hypothetical protein
VLFPPYSGFAYSSAVTLDMSTETTGSSPGRRHVRRTILRRERQKRPSGSILHLVLRTSDWDKATERARSAGGTVTQEPTNVVLEGDPPVPVRYSFCEGPDGEQIELFQAEAL